MRELSKMETQAVSGGVLVGTVVGVGLRSSPAAGLLAFSYYVGYQVGTAIYDAYTSFRY